MSKHQNLANHLKSLAAERAKNLDLLMWIDKTLLMPLIKSVDDGLQKTIFRVRLNPEQIFQLEKLGGDIEKVKAIVYGEGLDLVLEKGWQEFNEDDLDSNDIMVKIQW